ncbi:hypothetical protein OROMI_022009 [Orobanche minor]
MPESSMQTASFWIEIPWEKIYSGPYEAAAVLVLVSSWLIK